MSAQNSPDQKDPKHWEHPLYRKSRVAARLLMKAHRGKELKASEKALARSLAQNPGVTHRLIGQALVALKCPFIHELAGQYEF